METRRVWAGYHKGHLAGYFGDEFQAQVWRNEWSCDREYTLVRAEDRDGVLWAPIVLEPPSERYLRMKKGLEAREKAHAAGLTDEDLCAIVDLAI